MTEKQYHDVCMGCCHHHLTDNHRCIIYKDGICKYVYKFCQGDHYADKQNFASVDILISELKQLKRMTRVIQKDK